MKKKHTVLLAILISIFLVFLALSLLSPKKIYTIARLTDNGKEYLTRCNNSLNKINHPGFKYQLGIATTLKTSTDGYPTTEENEHLFEMEDRIIELYEKDRKSIWAGTITGGGIKEFYLYTNATSAAKTNFNILQREFSDYHLQLLIQDDPNWETYSAYCRKTN